VGVVDLNTLQTLPSLSAPHEPYDVEEGVEHRLFLVPSSEIVSGIMQVDADTGAFQGYVGDYHVEGPGFLEISPNRGALFFCDQYATLYKFNVLAAAPSVIQVADYSSAGGGLRIDPAGRLIVFPGGTGSGSPLYSTFAIPASNLSAIE